MSPHDRTHAFLTPTLPKQCWGFMIGSALFALGSAPGLAHVMGAGFANSCYFVGAWFFTAAGSSSRPKRQLDTAVTEDHERNPAGLPAGFFFRECSR